MASAAVHKSKNKGGTGREASSRFWIKSGSGKMEEPFVPGVTLPEKGNLRPKIKGGRVKEVKAAVPLLQPEGEGKVDDKAEGDIHESRTAMLGEEKESAERNLENERQHYEEQILKLVDQQEEILREREEVQKRMTEYQMYILKLQQQQKETEQKKLQVAEKSRSSGQYLPERGPHIVTRSKKSASEADPPDRITEEEEESCSEEEICEADGYEQPSKHFYLNDLDEEEFNDCDKRNKTDVENFSTQVQPSHSPHSSTQQFANGGIERGSKRDMKGPDGFSPHPDRPFTALIDKELENQKRVLEIAMSNSGNLAHTLGGGRSVEQLFQSGVVPLSEQQRTSPQEIQFSVPARPPPRPPLPSQHVANSNLESNFKNGRNEQQTGSGKNGGHFGRKEVQKTMIKAPVDDFPHGNLDLLTPEKNELLSRFMQSHSEMRLSKEAVEQDQREREINSQMKNTRTKIDEGEGGGDKGQYSTETNQNVFGPRGFAVRKESGEELGNIFVDNQENISPGKDPRNPNNVVNPSQVSTNHKSHHHRHGGNGGRKRRRPPPPSYGPLHPPVMSSTQKSSEIADFVSVTSTEVSTSERLRQLRLDPQGPPSSQVSTHKQNGDRNNHHQIVEENRQSPGRKGEGIHYHLRKGITSERAVEFSDKPRSGAIEVASPHEEDFLEKYRKMSPSERKRELLKQKSALLEEQARLKLVLAEQENQLQLKQQEAKANVRVLREMSEEEAGETPEVQQSLLQLEAELARKEQELMEGRELLRLKRQTQTQLFPEADKAFIESPSPGHRKSSKASVLSSTPRGGESAQVNVGEGQSLPLATVDKYENKTGRQDHEKPMPAKVAEAQTRNDEAGVNKLGSVDQDGVGVINSGHDEGKVDVATSISYAHFPNEKLRQPIKSSPNPKDSPRQSKATRDRKSHRHSVSPGEKTLSVLEIINSLDDDVVAITTSKSAARHHTTRGENPSNQIYARQTGSIVKNSSTKVWPGANLRNTRDIGIEDVKHLKSGFVKGHKGDFGTTRLGGSGSFGTGYYSASRVISEITSPSSGHLMGQALLASPRFTGEGKAGSFKQAMGRKASDPLEGETDENLDIFELKRIKGAHRTDPKDDEVFDLILESRADMRPGPADDHIDLSALYDDDADSNLDEIVRALEKEDEDEDEDEEEEGVINVRGGFGRRADEEGKLRIRNRVGKLKYKNEQDNADEDKLLALLVRNMDVAGLHDNDEDEDDEYNDYNLNIDGSDDDDEEVDDNIDEIAEDEDLEESQILEDVFFVQ
ncbi:hypothetical protein PoB_006290000 [Plakobranchus ocellatus]|uniref:Uncharacterized protein n=1 Tax=Plakobranchus ocellatus TaxID=259542 RepID=A0AAV4CX91_9GAST|nr:hypothetical protein PoB_006290000 [Plakobranchus ocellatus]